MVAGSIVKGSIARISRHGETFGQPGNRCFLASDIDPGAPGATGPGVNGLPSNFEYDLSPRLREGNAFCFACDPPAWQIPKAPCQLHREKKTAVVDRSKARRA